MDNNIEDNGLVNNKKWKFTNTIYNYKYILFIVAVVMKLTSKL